MPTDPATHDTEKPRAQLRCRSHGEFSRWLERSGGSLAITTYTSGKVVLLSTSQGRVRFRARKYPRPMGIALRGKQLALAVREKVLLFRHADRGKFQLQEEYVTGRVDAHDVAFGRRGIFFANTRFNCIARTSPEKRFWRTWLPPFIPPSARKDHCHLNGLGMRNGRPALATAFCASDQPGGWRAEDRFTGGVVLDIPSNHIAAGGLCMPHSPRRHQGQWWFCNSGLGELAVLQAGTARPICQLPGFTRGLCLFGDYALVGLSKIREKHILNYPRTATEMMAGVALVDLKTGRQTGALEFTRGGREVYEVLFLPHIPSPNLPHLQDQP